MALKFPFLLTFATISALPPLIFCAYTGILLALGYAIIGSAYNYLEEVEGFQCFASNHTLFVSCILQTYFV
jgi:hypothetical protein